MVRDAGAEVSEGRGERRSSFCGTQCRRGKCLTQLERPPKGSHRGKQYHDVEDIGKDSPLFRHAVPLCCKRRQRQMEGTRPHQPSPYAPPKIQIL